MTPADYWANVRTMTRVVRECPPRLVQKIIYNFAWRSVVNMYRFEKRQKQGKPFFPAFLMISITERCNLSCRGCWVSRGGKQSLSLEQLDGIITAGKKRGSYFFGILGGEPLLYKGLLDVLERHADCYFQLFTNGMLITDDIARRMRKAGHITPLISIEGLHAESDVRRGSEHVFDRTLAGVRACRKAGLFIGAAASICRSNYDSLVNRTYIDLLAKEGVHYLWYYIYRPVGSDPNTENALSHEQVLSFRRFVVEQRCNAPLLLIETYWDDRGNALCPAATGMSHHISPSGGVEFCPPLQMVNEFLNEDASNLTEIFQRSTFLADLRKMTAETSRGCILLENPSMLVEFLEQHHAIDSTTRGTVLEEYRRMVPQAGHHQPGEEIPEKNPFYRWAKKRYFFGFGAYG